MRSLKELVSIKNFLKELIDKETETKDQLTKSIFKYCPVEVAKTIIHKVEVGEDPGSVVTAFLSLDKDHRIDYGSVKWVD